MADLTPQQVAEQVREHLSTRSQACALLGIVVLGVRPGWSSVSMTVRKDMLNGLATCHGGLIATLADSAFAYACNSYNEVSVASSFGIELFAPAVLGDVLTATCSETSRTGRTGLYDAEITNQNDQRIAVFRGRSYTIKGKPVLGA